MKILFFLLCCFCAHSQVNPEIHGTFNGQYFGAWLRAQSKVTSIGIHYDFGNDYVTPTAGFKLGKKIGISFHTGIGFRPKTWEFVRGTFVADDSPRLLLASMFIYKGVSVGVMYETFKKEIHAVFGFKIF